MTTMGEIQDEYAFCMAVYVIFGGMSMADERILPEETSAIRAFLNGFCGIPKSKIDETYQQFIKRVKLHAVGRDRTLVDDAFDTLAAACGRERERKRLLVRLLFAIAKVDNVINYEEKLFAEDIARAFHLPPEDIAECAARGEETAVILRNFATHVDE